ncbi:MAG TPA: FHA domain-containing protein [Solirubrobacteraceae bacterium]|nr:FHA domain-containing protein [Solirubrobacteraceae bacterium]
MSTGPARLEVIAGKAEGTWIAVEDELVIGRQADARGRLADDEEISRTHARIALETGGRLTIEDLGSTNGTFVNGLRIAGPTALSTGDTIELGGTTLVVRELPVPAAQVSPPPLKLRIEIDLAAREARVELDDGAEPVRLKHVEGAWRVLPPQA